MAKKKTKPKIRTVVESSDLHEVFRAVIDQSGMNRAEIAHTLGIAESTLSRAYNGKGGVPWPLMQSVAKVADVRVVAKAETL